MTELELVQTLNQNENGQEPNTAPIAETVDNKAYDEDALPYVHDEEASRASLFEPPPMFHGDLNLANPSQSGIHYTPWERAKHIILSRFPIIKWLPTYKREWLINDVSSGLAVAAMAIPQAIVYPSIVGVKSPAFGFQCAFISTLIYPLFGTARHLTVGTASIAAIMCESVLQPYVHRSDYAEFVVTLSFVTGIFYGIMAFSGLGFMVSFLAYPVMTGFQGGCAVAIAATQIRSIFGLIGTVYTFYEEIDSFGQLGQTQYGPFLFFIICLFILRLQKYLIQYFEKDYANNKYFVILKNTPMPLVLIIVCTIINYGCGGLIDSRLQVKTVTFNRPGSTYYLNLKLVAQYPSTFILQGILFSVIIFTQHFSVAMNYGMKYEYDVIPFQELFAVSITNIIGSQFGIIPSGGVIAHAPLAEEKGAKTLLFNWVICFMVFCAILLLYFLNNLLYFLPKAVLASIVINAMLGLFPLQKMKEIWKIDSRDTIIMLITLFSTIFVGIAEGVAIGVGISILLNVQRTSKPHCAILGRLPNTVEYHSIVSWPNAITIPGIIVFRFDGQLYFGNISYFKQAVQTIVLRHHNFNKELYIFILDCLAINDIDSSGVVALDAIHKMLTQSNIIMMLCGVKYPVLKQLRRTSFISSIGNYHFFHGVHEAHLYIWRRLCFIRGIPVNKKDDFILSKDSFALNEEIVSKLRQPMSNEELKMLRSMSMDDSAVDTDVQRGFNVHKRKKLSKILMRSTSIGVNGNHGNKNNQEHGNNLQTNEQKPNDTNQEVNPNDNPNV